MTNRMSDRELIEKIVKIIIYQHRMYDELPEFVNERGYAVVQTTVQYCCNSCGHEFEAGKGWEKICPKCGKDLGALFNNDHLGYSWVSNPRWIEINKTRIEMRVTINKTLDNMIKELEEARGK